MPTVVVPFRGVEGKSRLGRLPREARAALAHAMLADVVEACLRARADVRRRARGHARGRGARVADPGGGPGSGGARRARRRRRGRRRAALPRRERRPACVTARDLFTLAGAVPDGGLALAAAADGTTNALALSSPDLFAPVYGPGSAARFAALAPSRAVDAPNLVDDVDTVADLERLGAARSARAHASVLASLRPEPPREGRPCSRAAWAARGSCAASSLSSNRTTSPSSATSGTTSRCSACTSRPTSTASSTRSPASPTRSAAGGAPTRRWNALETAGELGGEAWFRLGDRDIGLHLVRTQLLRAGAPLSEVTARLARAFGLRCALLPATDDPLRTLLETPAGTFPFQTWFVAPRPSRRGRRRPLHGRARGATGAGRARGDRGRRRDRDRAEQPVRLDRADPGGRRRSAPRSSGDACRASPSAR